MEHWTDRAQVVEVPVSAGSVRTTDKPPEGPRVAVA